MVIQVMDTILRQVFFNAQDKSKSCLIVFSKNILIFSGFDDNLAIEVQNNAQKTCLLVTVLSLSYDLITFLSIPASSGPNRNKYSDDLTRGFSHVQKDFTEQFRIKIRENFPQKPNGTIVFYRSADNRKFLEIKEHLARYVPHDRTFEKAIVKASNSLKTSRSVFRDYDIVQLSKLHQLSSYSIFFHFVLSLVLNFTKRLDSSFKIISSATYRTFCLILHFVNQKNVSLSVLKLKAAILNAKKYYVIKKCFKNTEKNKKNAEIYICSKV
ncbi:hypothetical protein BpHYR1_035443 [Brachionus plicatilis]|uniref:Uncharacterized protein n=1 Tax=Brachionus plicatilis TaxID=10195 RepID=A0A3M7SRC5_BRAPC|nr:hypothetical protein BpHYR1_035443 [Brachionus plicatilis]